MIPEGDTIGNVGHVSCVGEPSEVVNVEVDGMAILNSAIAANEVGINENGGRKLKISKAQQIPKTRFSTRI
jgi:hypothetical protein